MTTISTHVLNTATGKPGAAMKVLFEGIGPEGRRTAINQTQTNSDGRVSELVPAGTKINAGVYCLSFMTGGYFEAAGSKCFYPHVEVFFEVGSSDEHYHVPLLVSPFGFSTYRGS